MTTLTIIAYIVLGTINAKIFENKQEAFLPLLLGAAASIGMGLIKDGIDRRAQRRQQNLLNQQQMAQQEKLNAYNQQLGMKTWEQTNYSAQMAQMEKAGLNPGLMYGMGGTGGATLSNAGGNINGGHAIEQSKNTFDITGMGLQLGMMKAQKENLEAQTENINADTINKEEGTAGISADSRNKSMLADITEATYWDQVLRLQGEAHKAYGEGESATAKGSLDWEVLYNRVEQEKLKTIQMGVEVKNKEAELALTEEQVKETTAKIEKIVTEIQNMKDLTEIQRQDMLNRRMQTEFNTSTPAQIKQWTDIGTDILKATKSVNINETKTYNNNKNYDRSNTINNYE